jgi:hypothetical protein
MSIRKKIKPKLQNNKKPHKSWVAIIIISLILASLLPLLKDVKQYKDNKI